jgi:hypothetical protein
MKSKWNPGINVSMIIAGSSSEFVEIWRGARKGIIFVKIKSCPEKHEGAHRYETIFNKISCKTRPFFTLFELLPYLFNCVAGLLLSFFSSSLSQLASIIIIVGW